MPKKATLTLYTVILILIYFFSFHIFPKLNSNNKYDYRHINTNAKEIFGGDWALFHNSNSRNNHTKTKQYQFKIKFLSYLDNSPDIKKNAPCPSEIFENNLRNIQIYKNIKNDFEDFDYLTEFNLRFIVNKFRKSSIEKSNIDRCFYFLFVETLNKFYLQERDLIIQELESQRKLVLTVLGKDLPSSQNITFTSFMEELKKGNIVSVNMIGSYVEGIFVNGKKFATYTPLHYSGLVEQLISKGTLLTVEDPDTTKKNTQQFYMLGILIEQYKKNNFFINPDSNYKYIKNEKKNIEWAEFITFFLCILIFAFIKIGSRKLNRKQLSKFFNKFINT